MKTRQYVYHISIHTQLDVQENSKRPKVGVYFHRNVDPHADYSMTPVHDYKLYVRTGKRAEKIVRLIDKLNQDGSLRYANVFIYDWFQVLNFNRS